MLKHFSVFFFLFALSLPAFTADAISYYQGHATLEAQGKTSPFGILIKSFSKDSGIIQFIHRYSEEKFSGVIMNVELKKNLQGSWEFITQTIPHPKVVFPVTIEGTPANPKSFTGSMQTPEKTTVKLTYKNTGTKIIMDIYEVDGAGKNLTHIHSDASVTTAENYEKVKAKFKQIAK